MRCIDHRLIRYERQIAIVLGLLLLCVNLGSLYYVIELMSYDEIVGYQSDGILKSSDPRDFTYPFLIITLLNILYVFTVLCAWFHKKN